MEELSEEEIERININHISRLDKWFRMFGGFSSNLVQYRNEIIHIEVINTESKFESNRELILKVIESWKTTLQNEVKNRKGIVIYLYKTNKSVGFNIPAVRLLETRFVKSLISKIKKKENLSLVEIFSGIIS